MEQFKLLFGLFITIVVAIALVVGVADELWKTSDTDVMIAENISVEALRTDANMIYPNVTTVLANDDIFSIDGVEWMNGSAMTLNTDYYLNDSIGAGTNAPRVSFANTTISHGGHIRVMNYTTWNYTHAGDTYLQGSAVNRTILNLVLIFFVVGIIASALVYLSKTDLFNR